MMLYTLIQTALLAALAARQVAAELQISTPILTQCEDVHLEWTGGVGPYNLYVVPSADSCADSVLDIPEQSGNSYKWKVNIPEGSSVEILVEDASQDEGWTAVMKVGKGSDASCVDKKAAQALLSTNPSTSGSSGSESSGAGSSGPAAVPVTNPAASPRPVSSPDGGVANAASGQDSVYQTSGSTPHAALPTGSLLATVMFLLAFTHF